MVVTEDCRGFIVINFAALLVDNVLADEAAIVVPHKSWLLFLGLMLLLLMSLMFWI